MPRLQNVVTAVLIALTAAGTTWVTTLSWRAFVHGSRHFLVPLLVVALVVALVGFTVRVLRGGALTGLVAQLVFGGATVSWLVGGSPIPYGSGWTSLVEAIGRAVDTSAKVAPPAPAGGDAGVAPLLILGGFACLVAVDLLAGGLRRPALAGLPLLVSLSVPFAVSGEEVVWWVFAVSVAGFLSLVGLHERDLVGRWGRRLDEDEPLPRPPKGAAMVGGAATALAVIMPAALPGLDVNLFGFGHGSGSGDDITVSNPMVSMREDLVRGADRPAVRVVTDDPDPKYLRIAVLNRFGANEWSAGNRQVPEEQDAQGKMPPIYGVADGIRRAAYDYRVIADERFESRWLPTQQHVERIDAVGDWRYDTETMDFIAGDDGLTTAGLDYTFTALELALTSNALEDATAGTTAVDATYREVPQDVPPSVELLAEEVTDGATSSFERAVALQHWFRVSGGFTYDTDVAIGSGPRDLVTFLSEGPGGRTGFCQQFATAMAVMARELGIPARVAVGFLEPEETGPDEWLYSTHDLHAWPELFFSGFGWVAFEPTPPVRAAATPSYTRGIDIGRDPGDRPSTAAPLPQGEASAGPQPRMDEQINADGDGDGDGGFPWVPFGLGVLLLALAAGLAAVPSWLRRQRRARRLLGGPEEVWAELRDTVVDLGLRWPEGRSPRVIGEVVGSYVVTVPGRTALGAVVAAVETTRYSPRPQPVELSVELAAVLEGLEAGVPASVRRHAAWWPRSVVGHRLSLRPQSTAVAPGRLAEDEQDLVDHAR